MIQTRENYRKPQIWVILGPFAPIMGRENFFSKIGLRHFHRFIEGYLDAKNKKKLMMGSIRTFVTDRRSSFQRTRRMTRVQKVINCNKIVKSLDEIIGFLKNIGISMINLRSIIINKVPYTVPTRIIGTL